MRESDATLHPASVGGPYVISSNPPNPRTDFRTGDWRCPVKTCAAHNFGRNIICVSCGRSRLENIYAGSMPQGLPPNASSPIYASPRFATPVSGFHPFGALRPAPPPMPLRSATDPSPVSQHARLPPVQHAPPGGAKPASSPYPLLTPSGRALSIGGRVQNISRDPLVPCIMYWPDNEPIPDQGQMRPLGSAVIQYPPIINTGNKGAAEKQPGDWICHKCHYLNWRRRKVCQTCFPYAEGNGDSISAAVQAERIALLENVLASQVHGAQQQYTWHAVDAASGAVPKADARPRSFVTPPVTPTTLWSEDARRPSAAVHDFQQQRHPIYQTDGNALRQRLGPLGVTVNAAPAPPTTPLLPSFLQDIVQSPALSPSTSTSSTDLSLEDHDGVRVYGARRAPGGGGSGAASSFTLPGHSIWKLDGEESKTLSGSAAGPAHPAGAAEGMPKPDVSMELVADDSEEGTSGRWRGR
ncbi:hypothetical protein IEO21_04432 [Rhodonia placenta]|uniref:RanBP2-type domain-containing protein n=1 Tax=Rhodonia placenta TaxID=104341 RepID=A0A8H7P455_9APHY|nr:hypothetical protein IEO21_04432 [Postia placenta]